MIDLTIMALALFVFWFTADKQAFFLLMLWALGSFFYIEDPSWFAFYAILCGAGCVISKSIFVICLYIAQLLIALLCLVEWQLNGDLLLTYCNYLIWACICGQLAGVTCGNINFRVSGNIFDRNLSFEAVRN